jgi:solute carrier family 12 sodium/potassium/chloride transporter 2
VNWGSTTEDQVFTKALSSLNRLNQIPNHVKNYRPSILLLAGNPSARQPLVSFANCLTKNVGLLNVAQISRGLPNLPENERQLVVDSLSGWMKHHKVRGFFVYAEADSMATGTKRLLQLSGIGKMRPNVLMMGFKNDWRETSERDMLDYFDTLRFVCSVKVVQSKDSRFLFSTFSVAFEMYMAIAIFRNSVGLDFTNYMQRANSASYSIELNGMNSSNGHLALPGLTGISGEAHNRAFESDFDISSPAPVPSSNNNNNNAAAPEVDTDDDVFVDSKPNATLHAVNGSLVKVNPLEWPAFAVFQPETGKTPEAVGRELNRFSTRQPKGYIDVWWIHDDGGLTLLLPYILSKHKYWNQNQLRVFTVVPKDANYDQQKYVPALFKIVCANFKLSVVLSLRKLMKQFRIPFSEVIVITEPEAKPSEFRKQKFKILIEKHMAPSSTESANLLAQITKQDLVHHKDRVSQSDSGVIKLYFKIRCFFICIFSFCQTCKILKIRDLLENYSKGSNLVVM